MSVTFPEPENAFDTEVLQGIQQQGWFVLNVPEDVEGPGFAFTVGLWMNYQHPELVMFGLDADVMHRILNLAGDEISRGAQQFEPGDFTASLLDGAMCCFVKIGAEAYPEYLGYAVWLYSHQAFPALQCIWPDRQGHFPWQPQFAPALMSRQPLLGGTDQLGSS